MRNWYTLPLTLLFISCNYLVANAQHIVEVQWSAENIRYPMELSTGQTSIHICGLAPGGSYSLIANPMGGDPTTRFSWKIRSALQHQLHPVLPNSIYITANSECATLELEMSTPQNSGTKPVYLSIQRTDEVKPPEPPPTDQAEMVNLSTTGGIAASTLVSNVLIGGNCFDVSNVTSFGNPTSRGTFTNGGTNVGLNNGVVLSTGNVGILPGPNNQAGAYGGYILAATNDPDLATLTGGVQHDLSRIEFDFRPTSPLLSFEFVFGSEEYCEYVGSAFNDVFGFFISGPGIAGNQNIALVPSTSIPVSINNVNDVDNAAFFVGNSLSCGSVANAAECQLDGWTSVFTATAQVIPCETYHIKLAIADVGDDAFTSAVFLNANSFDAGGIVKAQPIYPGSLSFVYEECGQGYIRFFRGDSDLSEPLEVNFTVSGTATPGDDYDPIVGPFIIPAGQASILVPINVLADLIAEGNETIIFSLENPCACTQTQITFNIQDLLPMTVTLDDVTGCGSSSAVLSPSVSGAQAPLTYLWSTGNTSPSLNVTTAGTTTYTVTVTDACGRTSTDDATVTLAPAPTAALSGSGLFCEGSTDPVDLTLTLTGEGPWTVTWLANGSPMSETFLSSPATISATSGGPYTLVSVVSENGCTGTVSGNVNLPTINVNLNLTPVNPSCFGLTNGSINAVPSGGTAPYTYAWDPSGSSANLSNLGAGTYTVTVTSSQGCTETAEVTLTEPPLLTAEITTPGMIDCFTPLNTLDLTVNGGTPNYLYIWSNGSGTQDPNVTAGGTYTVTVRDARNCTTTATVTVVADLAQPTATILPPVQLNCNVLTQTLDASGSSQGPNFQYNWSGGGITCCDNTLQPQINQAGPYTLTVTNTENGCTRTASVTVFINDTPPNVNATAPFNIGCNHPTVTLSGAGSAFGPGITYQWSTSDGNIQSGATTLNPVVNQAGTYTLVVTNNNTGCTATESVTITGDTQVPTAVVAPAGIVDCYNPVLQLDGSGSSQGAPGFNYNWTGGTITSGGNTLTPTVSSGGTYTLVVTNPSNSCTATATVTVAANLAIPSAAASAPNGINCQNATVVLNGSGSSTGPNFSYQWTSSNGGNIISGATTLNPIANQGGTYTLVVTNETNGCTREVSVNVIQDQSVPIASAGPDRVLNCYTPSLQLTGSASTGPSFTFTWTANPGGFAFGQNTLNPTVNQPGTYTLAVTNTSTGCTSSDIVVVTSDFNTPVAQIAPPQILTCEFPVITLDGTNSSTGPNITYNWTTNGGLILSSINEPTVSIAGIGTYRLVVTNEESGCTAQTTVNVTENTTLPFAEAGPTGNLTCQTPTLTLNGAGSSIGSIYDYQWSTVDGNIVSGGTALIPVIDAPGVYTLLVTNTVNGCTAQDNVTITTAQDLPVANAGPDIVRTCVLLNPVINGAGSSTGPGIQYQWTANPGTIVSGGTTRTPLISQDGVYTIVVTNTITGCTDTDEVTVTNNIVNPIAVLAPPAQITCFTPVIELDATGSTQTGIPVYNWSTTNGSIVGGGNTPTPQVDGPGIYRITITNLDNSCTAVAQVSVTQDVAPPQAAATVNDILSCQNAQVQLSGAGSSSGPIYQYQWSTGDGNILSGAQTLSPTVNAAGTYTLTVQSNQNGCTNVASTLVQSNQDFPTVDPGAPQTLSCAITQLTLDAGGSSQGASYAYIWDTPDGNIVSGDTSLQPLIDAPGTYNLNIVNQLNGCAASASVLVDTDYTAPLAIAAPGGVLSCSVATLSLNGSGSSAGTTYTYDWNTQNGNIISGDSTLQPVVNAVGSYTLVVTDSGNGCTAAATTSVLADASLPVANAGMPDTLTCSVTSVTIDASASSQGADYGYAWAGPGNVGSVGNLQPVVTQPGEYFLTVTNNTNGCTAISTVSIAQDTIRPVAEAGPASELTCAITSLSLNGSASSNGPLFQYAWTGSAGGQIVSGANTAAPLIDAPGTYQLLVTNTFNNCSASDQVAITEDVALPSVEAGPPATLTCVIPTITLAGQGSNDPIMQYVWTTSDGNIASGDSTLTPVVDAPGTYNVLVTNTYNACTASDQVLIDRDANVPEAVAEVSGELNCVVASLQLSGANSTQGATLTYTWTSSDGYIVSGANSLAPVVDAPGSYTLEVFNTANSCVALSTVLVNENLAPPAAAAGNPAVLSCANPVLTLDGAGSSVGNQYTYVWNTQDGNILQGATNLQPQVDQSGFYNLVVTDNSNGCTAESTVQILLDQNTPEADAGASPTLTCAVTNLTLDGTGSSLGNQFSYKWTTLDGEILSGDSTLSPLIAAPGTYMLLVSNVNNGCVSDAEVLVNQDIEAPAASAGHETTLTCTQLTTELNVMGSSTGADFSYQWTTGNGEILSGADTPVPTVGEPGVYQLTVRNLLTGCANTASVLVPEDVAVPAAAAAVSGELTCLVQSLPLSAGGSSTGADYSYLWTTASGNIVSGSTGTQPSVNEPGVYNLLVTNDINGCTSTSSVAVDQNVTAPMVNATVSNLLTCSVTQIQLQGSASGGAQGVNYAWTGPNIIGGATTATPTIGAIGEYVLTATDLYNGCVASDPVLVSNDVNPPAINIASPAQLTCAVTQTSIVASGSTGSQFNYQWTGSGIVSGVQTLTPVVNQPGPYSLLITNTSNGCTSTQQTTVTQNIQPPLAQAGGAFELSCSVRQGPLSSAGSTTGNGINYVWSTNDGNIISGIYSAEPLVDEPGLYTLTVINAQTGCQNTAAVAITENTNYPASLQLSRVLPKCGGQPGEVVVQAVNGGVGPYLYSIDGGDNFVTANEFTDLGPGSYEIVVQDVNGCEYGQIVPFPVPVEPQVTLPPEITLVFGQDAKLTAALNIPLQVVDTIIWEPSETLTFTDKINEVFARPFKDTEYTVRVINIDGCETVDRVLVRVKDPQIWAPNVFSPLRKDGNSDYFLIFAGDQTVNKINSLQVYDRWGTMVFQTTDIQPNVEKAGWDGSFRGKTLTPAVFVWWADVELADGQRIVLKGDVTIVD